MVSPVSGTSKLCWLENNKQVSARCMKGKCGEHNHGVVKAEMALNIWYQHPGAWGETFGLGGHARAEVGENRTSAITTTCFLTRDPCSSLSRSRGRNGSPHCLEVPQGGRSWSRFATAAGPGPEQPHFSALGKCLCLVPANATRGWRSVPVAGSRLCHGAVASFNSPCRSCWVQEVFRSWWRVQPWNHWSSH